MAVRIALAGIGKIARDQHIPSIAASPDWELAATVSRHARIDDVEAFTDIDSLLSGRPDIEVVSLCMPPAPRFEYAAAALRAGRHVMLEKPPGATLAECVALEALARDKGLSLYATWHSRKAAQVEKAGAWLRDKRLVSATVTWKEDVRRWHPGQDWIWRAGGLGVFDSGVNALSILTAILPDPLHLKAATLEVPENRETPIAASLDFAHPGGAAVTAVFDWRQEGEQTWTIDVDTDAGRMRLADGGATMTIDGKTQADTDEDGNALQGEYSRLYARMADLVRNGAMDMDLSPMIHVADAFLLGRRVTVEPFDE